MLSLLTIGVNKILKGISFDMGEEGKKLLGDDPKYKFEGLDVRQIECIVWSPYADLRLPIIPIKDNQGDLYPYWADPMFKKILLEHSELITWKKMNTISDLTVTWNELACLSDIIPKKIIITYPTDRLSAAHKQRVDGGQSCALEILTPKNWQHFTIKDPQPCDSDTHWSHYSNKNLLDLYQEVNDYLCRDKHTGG